LVAAVVFYERRKARRRLERMEAQQAVERERRRIARDLHDDLGARVTKISMLAGMEEGDTVNADEASARLRDIYSTSQEMVQAMDETVWVVNPRNDTLTHLAHYIIHYAEEFFQPTNIRRRLKMPEDLPALPLPADARHNIFMAVKEALNNTVKHAGASEIRVEISLEGPVFRVAVSDNGKGFSPDERRGAGDGLENMKERLAHLGGTCEVRATPGVGTTVMLALNLNSLPAAG
jgi:signal transduction histidine kinase